MMNGLKYSQDRDLELNFRKHLRKAEAGDCESMLYIADAYYYGWGCVSDEEMYHKFIRDAAVAGSEQAGIRLFYEALANGDIGSIENTYNTYKANRRDQKFQLSIEGTHLSTIYNILMNLSEKTISALFDAFEKEKWPSNFYLDRALCYQRGLGVSKDIDKAIYYIKEFVKQYSSSSEQWLANIIGMLEKGEISSVDGLFLEKMLDIDIFSTYSDEGKGYVERIMIFTACSGNVKMQEQTAHLYLTKKYGFIDAGEDSNDFEALRWLNIAAKNGSQDAADKMLLILWDEESIAYDLRKAIQFCKDVLDDKYPLTKGVFYVCLGELYDEIGEHNNAFNTYYEYAQQGNPLSQGRVAHCYFNGRGVELDIDKAYYWWKQAAEGEDEDAIKAITIIRESGNGDEQRGVEILKQEVYGKRDNQPQSNGGQSGNSNGGCYVATCVYGSYDCPEVWTLRRYRDNKLATTWCGRSFIHIYYAISPGIVKVFGNQKWFRNFWRKKLDRMIIRLNQKGYNATPYDDIQW